MEQRLRNKIVDLDEAIAASERVRQKGKTIILAGGCFDILHIGHISFLEAAKQKGDTLFVLLESDKRIRELKGEGRPINTQHDRAAVLATLSTVDYIVVLPYIAGNEAYDKLIFAIRPAIIATTKADPSRTHKERQAKDLGISVYDVIDRIENQSTSRMAQLLHKK